MYINLDMDVLRTLVTTQQLGGFNRAAAEIGRSQSAVSQQIRKLEEQVGQALFRKQGRNMVLTEVGETVLRYAHRILALNDEAIAAVRGESLEGVVRLGVPADLAETSLPAALGQFKRAYPSVRVEAVVDRNRHLLEELDKGRLDLVLALGSGTRRDAHRLAQIPMVWVGPASGEAVRVEGQPLPLAVFQTPCFFHRAATQALDDAGMRWRVVFTSSSLSGLWAAVSAGLGVTLRTPLGLPPSLTVLGRSAGLPVAPPIDLCVHDAGRALSPAAARLKQIASDVLSGELARAPRAPLRVTSKR